MLHDATLAIDSGGTIEADYFTNGASSMNVQVCFAAGYEIELADGTTKKIKDFEGGETVWARAHNKPNGSLQKCKVVRGFKNGIKETMLVRFNNGLELRGTKEHPFYVQGKGWRPLGKLAVGDVCYDKEQEPVIVKELIRDGQAVEVYNIEVEEAHTYYIGKDGQSILVHNECPIHSYTVFPDCIDKYLNASRNGINYYLFGMPIKTTCTCGIIIPKQTEDYSLGSLSAFSLGGMSLQNRINAEGQVIDYAYRAANALEAGIFVAGILLPGPDDLIWDYILTKYGIQIAGKVGARFVYQDGNKLSGEALDAAKEILTRMNIIKHVSDEGKHFRGKTFEELDKIFQKTVENAQKQGKIFENKMRPGSVLYHDDSTGTIVIYDGKGSGTMFKPDNVKD